MARVQQDPRFSFRATAVIVDRGRVLGHRPVDAGANATWWALPGGGPSFREPTSAAVVRELQEELCVAATIDRLLFVVEHFFGTDADPRHGIDFVHLAAVPDGWPQRDVDEFLSDGEEAYGKLLQRWLPLTEDGLADLYPECLRTLLLDGLPEAGSPRHVVHWQS